MDRSAPPPQSDTKSVLAERARQALDRAQRAQAPEIRSPAAEPDLFSHESLARRLAFLEHRVEGLARDYGSALNTLTFALERIETRSAVLSGEVKGAADLISQAEIRVAEARSEVESAGAALADSLKLEIGAAVDKLAGLAKEVMGAQDRLIGLAMIEGDASASGAPASPA